VSEEIERHIDFIDPKDGRSVRLAAAFVRQFQHRPGDHALPWVAAISTLPMVLSDGALLQGRGLDRARNIIFRIPPELLKYLPTKGDCHECAVVDALAFLVDVWLVDVATNYTGKCLVIAAALTVIERTLMYDRPGFFVTAGKRGGGKTTLLSMLMMAALGVRPSAAAWSPNVEERRKALLSYLMEGMPAIIWDNIPLGALITCQYIEASLTASSYSDRLLGASRAITVSPYAIHFFTGNNIAPTGDLASRAPIIRLESDRADPENRPFVHPDPVGWTEANRGKILNALFTVLLGNPRLRDKSPPASKTRFKDWYRLVGSAIEHAVTLSGGSVDFGRLFLSQEAEDQEISSLAEALAALAEKWPNKNPFTAGNVAALVNDHGNYGTDTAVQGRQVLRDVLFPKAPPNFIATPLVTTRRLRHYCGTAVILGDKTYILKSGHPPGTGKTGTLAYSVQVSGGEEMF
jgi:hypothetical protein